MQNLGTLLKNGDIAIVDVRTPGEFMGGHVAGSRNIPLQEIPNRMDELKQLKKIILCCASGARSMQATEFLQQQGIDCENGGSWIDVNDICCNA